MALRKRPLVYDDVANRLRRAITDAEVIAGEYLQISDDADNALKLGTDKGLYVYDKQSKDLISTDPDNALKVDKDGKLTLVPGDLVSTDTDNVIKVGTDNKLVVETVKPGDLISTDADNQIKLGADGKLMTDKVVPGDLVSTDADNMLGVGADNNLFVRTPKASDYVSADAGNDVVVGTDGGLFVDVMNGVDVKVDDLILAKGNDELYTTLKMTYVTSSGQLKLTGVGNKAISTVTLPKYSFIEDFALEENPADQPAGTYLKLTCRTTGNKVQTVYVDVTKLVDIYEGADASIDVTDYKIKVVPDPSGPVMVNARGVTLNQSRLISNNKDNALKRGTDGKLFVDATALTPAKTGRDAMTVADIVTIPADLNDGGLLAHIYN